ncbi:UNVERIFIED_CONTAM: hypothetical protein K2H54_023726 [Gekko kuhli]
MAAAEVKLCRDCNSDYPEVVVRVGEITFGEEQRSMKDRIKEIEATFREQNKKDKSKKANKDTEKAISQLKSKVEETLKQQVTDLSHAACALLNSGGGVIRAEIENKDYSYKRHRIGLDIEDSFRECIQHRDFSEYFDFKQEEFSMLIFVKSWSSENSAHPRVCSLNMGLYERSSSSAVKMKPANAVHFLKRKKDHAKRGSGWQAGPALANIQKRLWGSGVQMEKDINDAATQFFERERLDFGEILDFTESTMVEFKDFPRDKDNYEFARSILPRYASAFANTKGGYLIFGVDNHRRVVGCKRNICPSHFVEVAGETIGALPVFHFCASEEKVVFLCKVLPVYDSNENGEEKERGYVFAVRIKPSCCTVFERTPDSWIIEAGEMKRLTCPDWTLLMTEEDPDVSHFAEGFQIELSRSCKPPLSKSVYSNKGLTCVKTLQSTLFPVNPDGITCKPEKLCKVVFLEYPSLKDVMMKKMEEVSPPLGILIFSRSWAVDVGLQKHPYVTCDILLIAADTFPTLYTVTVDKDHSVSSTVPVWEYSRNVACALKQKLVNEGGCTQKVCVIPHVIELRSNGEIKIDLSWPITYPLGYLVSRDGLVELLQALVIALLRFRSFLSDQIGCEFFNLLTIKQYEILTKNLHKSKRLFVYGLPGSGKTVVALQIIQKIMNVFQCTSGEILYICENRPLCRTVRMRVGNMCQTVTRIDFLNGDYSRPVKHIVIDEAQSFQSKDGDWYGKAVRLTAVDPCKPDVLWIFLDYLQTSHSKDSGLPDASKQEPQEWLTTGVRNATQVYNVMMHVTEMIANDRSEHVKKLADILGHDNSQMFSGAVHVCAAVIELLQEKLRSPVEPDILYDQLKCLQAEIQPGNTMEVWYPNYFCGLVSKSDLHNFRNRMAIAMESQLCLDIETDHAEFIISVGKVLFGERQRSPRKKKKVLQEMQIPVNSKTGAVEGKKKGDGEKLTKERANEVLKLTRAACALLNSGGGVIRASVSNQGYSSVQDGIGQDIHRAFRECIHSEELSEYFDFIQEGQHFMIWVKAWSSANSSKPRICNVETGLHQRNGESAMKLKDLTFLKEKIASAKRDSDVMSPKKPRLQNNIKGSTGVAVEMASGIRKAAIQFFERDQLEHGEILSFTEWTMVEFKEFPREGSNLDFVRNTLGRYVSAFANTQGGYLMFGVNNNRKVVGCKGNVNPAQVKEVVVATIDAVPCFHLDASKPKVDYKFKAQAVFDEHGKERGYVFVVRIESFPGIVFSEEPDSWIVEADRLKRFEIAEWLKIMTAEDPDLSKLAEQFTKELSLSDGPPMIKPVYSVQGLDSLEVLRRKFFPEPNRMTFVPQPLCDKLFLEYPGLKALLAREIEPPVQGTLMLSRSWAMDIGLPKNRAIVCDALLMVVGCYPVLCTVVENPTSDVYEHSRSTARLLKQKLANVGGYSQKICVIPKVLYLQPTNGQDARDQRLKYPEAYRLRQKHLPNLQKALVIVLFGFTSFSSDFIGVEFLNLLTYEQYETLSKKLDGTREQFIYGIPGSGKTVVALKIMEKIKNEFGCQPDEILYICENKPLRDFVGKKVSCAVTRATFMKEEFPNVKHIVIDEAQNFRVEHRQWYKKAKEIVHRDPNTLGIFWIFLDYFQMSHPFESGLPLPSRQYPRGYLTKGVRNASTIYEVVRVEMEKIVEGERLDIPYPQLRELLGRACCGNSVAGRYHIKLEMEVREIALYVARQCRSYLDAGYSEKDIAILCSTKEITSCYQRPLVEEMRKLRLDVSFVQANEILKDKIVLDSIRRFSGLERTIVFGINPVPTQEKVSRHLLLCVASRANKQLHLLYEKEQIL